MHSFRVKYKYAGGSYDLGRFVDMVDMWYALGGKTAFHVSMLEALIGCCGADNVDELERYVVCMDVFITAFVSVYG